MRRPLMARFRKNLALSSSQDGSIYNLYIGLSREQDVPAEAKGLHRKILSVDRMGSGYQAGAVITMYQQESQQVWKTVW